MCRPVGYRSGSVLFYGIFWRWQKNRPLIHKKYKITVKYLLFICYNFIKYVQKRMILSMNGNVIVTIKGLEYEPDGSAGEEIETCQPGVYKFLQKKHIITYEEPCEGNPRESVHNLLKINEDTVSILRRGQIDANMVFKEGYHHSGTYGIAYGASSLPFDIKTSHLAIAEDTDCINIEINYSLGLGNSYVSRRTVCINIHSAGILPD